MNYSVSVWLMASSFLHWVAIFSFLRLTLSQIWPVGVLKLIPVFSICSCNSLGMAFFPRTKCFRLVVHVTCPSSEIRCCFMEPWFPLLENGSGKTAPISLLLEDPCTRSSRDGVRESIYAFIYVSISFSLYICIHEAILEMLYGCMCVCLWGMHVHMCGSQRSTLGVVFYGCPP